MKDNGHSYGAANRAPDQRPHPGPGGPPHRTDGQQLGIKPLPEALALARDLDLDLVEVAA